MKNITKITMSSIMVIGLAFGYYGTSSNYGGSTTYHSFSDGTYGTSSNYGGSTTYHNLYNYND